MPKFIEATRAAKITKDAHDTIDEDKLHSIETSIINEAKEGRSFIGTSVEVNDVELKFIRAHGFGAESSNEGTTISWSHICTE